MSFRTMAAADRQVLIAGVVITITALISFVDPAGTWGGIMVVSVLAGLAAAYVAVQPQVAPSMRMPMTKGLSLVVLGVAATTASVTALLSYLGYVFQYLTDVYVLIFLVGLVASISLLWIGWRAYKAESGVSAAPPQPPAEAPPPPPAA
jgi:hypothetical protein